MRAIAIPSETRSQGALVGYLEVKRFLNQLQLLRSYTFR
jgi:hypothetical protein